MKKERCVSQCSGKRGDELYTENEKGTKSTVELHVGILSYALLFFSFLLKTITAATQEMINQSSESLGYNNTSNTF